MSAQVAHAHGPHAHEVDQFILCPNCGGDDFRSGWLDDRPLQLAARAVNVLRALGHDDAADDVQCKLLLVTLINRRRHRFECADCGAQFSE